MTLKTATREKLREFLKEYPDPYVRVVTTVHIGYISFIKPVPTICGAELLVDAAHIKEVNKIINEETLK